MSSLPPHTLDIFFMVMWVASLLLGWALVVYQDVLLNASRAEEVFKRERSRDFHFLLMAIWTMGSMVLLIITE